VARERDAHLTSPDLTRGADQERLGLGPTELLTRSRVSLVQFEQRVIQLLHEVTSAA